MLHFQRKIPQYSALLLNSVIPLDDLPVDLPQRGVDQLLSLINIGLNSVGVGSYLRNGKEVRICKQFFLEVAMPPECLVQDLVRLIKDVIVQLAELFKHQLFLLTFYLLFLCYDLIRANFGLQ